MPASTVLHQRDRVGLVAHSVSELGDALRSVTHDPSVRQRLLATRDDYVTRYLGADGRAAGRVATLIEELSARTSAPPSVSASSRERIA